MGGQFLSTTYFNVIWSIWSFIVQVNMNVCVNNEHHFELLKLKQLVSSRLRRIKCIWLIIVHSQISHPINVSQTFLLLRYWRYLERWSNPNLTHTKPGISGLRMPMFCIYPLDLQQPHSIECTWLQSACSSPDFKLKLNSQNASTTNSNDNRGYSSRRIIVQSRF